MGSRVFSQLMSAHSRIAGRSPIGAGAADPTGNSGDLSEYVRAYGVGGRIILMLGVRGTLGVGCRGGGYDGEDSSKNNGTAGPATGCWSRL